MCGLALSSRDRLLTCTNRKTNVNTTWEFVATDFGAFFPSVTKSSNGTFEMEWKNGGRVLVLPLLRADLLLNLPLTCLVLHSVGRSAPRNKHDILVLVCELV